MANRALFRDCVRSVVLACLLGLAATSRAAQPEVRYVLILQSLSRGNIVLDSLTSQFRVDLERLAGEPVNVVQIVIGTTGFIGAPEDAVVDYIRSTFPHGLEPDLIVTVGAPATVFARKYRQHLFPDKPLLACVDQRFLDDVPLEKNETAVAGASNFSLIIEDILQLLPETRQVFMVVGAGPIGNVWLQKLKDELKRFRSRVTFVWSNDLSLPQIVHRCANLPPGSAIFFFSFGSDAAGAAYTDERVLGELQATANAPLFAAHTAMLGHGIVGGRMMNGETLAARTAGAAIRILNGAAPAQVRVPPQVPGQPTFDWRELKRWGIPESRLPAGSVVLYRAPSLWREYRLTILSAVGVLIMQTLLIAGLFYQRRARQRAEIDSRRHLALAADVSRRQTMSTLTSTIAHELGQPLNSMMLNAQALQMMVTADGASSATIAEILSDIQTQGVRATEIINRHRTMLKSHAVEKKQIDLRDVIKESVALVANDMRERQIEGSVDLSSSPCVVSGDEVLLRQVLVNLLMNAMDAMVETPPDRRRLTIRSESGDGHVQASVRDTGSGLPAHVIDTLFTPFVTTKSHGLGIGLTIARSIVDAHGGSIAGRNHPQGGATFTVRLPCDDGAKIESFRRARPA